MQHPMQGFDPRYWGHFFLMFFDNYDPMGQVRDVMVFELMLGENLTMSFQSLLVIFNDYEMKFPLL